MIEVSHLNEYLSTLKEVGGLSIPSKTILLKEGNVADKLYLIRKGCMRLFFYHEGKDITFQFFFEGDFVASFDSLYKRQPSLFFLESIEPTEVFVIKRDDFYALIETVPSLKKYYEEKLIKTRHNSGMKNYLENTPTSYSEFHSTTLLLIWVLLPFLYPESEIGVKLHFFTIVIVRLS